MLIKRNALLKYYIAVLLGATLYAEKFIYIIQTLYWNDLKCVNDDETCTKILFIADPQIQGDLAAPVPFNYLFNWDSDRYLRATFTRVFNYYEPDVMVFLGDLMDEGSVATMKQYYNYVKRLSNIYDVHKPVVQVWVPGDNDIGGENERIDWDKLRTFDDVFDQPAVVRFRNVSFYKVNAITHTVPAAAADRAGLRVAVSHYPLLARWAFADKVNKSINPHIYFCAHDHESKYTKQTKAMEERYARPVPFYDNEVLEISFDADELYEVYVPTCSYRMGTSNIGYGAAILERGGRRMRYTVPWSPRRFPALAGYAAALAGGALAALARGAVLLAARLLRRPGARPDSLHIKI